MTHHNPGANAVPPQLANSYGLEVGASEHQRHPSPQVVPDNSATAPQVVTQPHQKPVEYVPYPGPAAPSEKDPSKGKSTILGLTRPVFWVIVGLVVLGVLGVALGAGLGVGLSNNHRSKDAQTSTSAAPTPSPTESQTPPTSGTTPAPSSTPSSSATPTSSAPVTKGTTGLAANSCNSTVPRTVFVDNTAFTEYCFTDWPDGDESFDGKGTITDLTRSTVYTFEACLAACLTYNEALGDGGTGTRCTAVTYNSNLTSIIAVGRQGGNCFLKDKRGVSRQGSAESACAALTD